jgi:dihydrodipicolinate synthase/N-acetylneuraminate lyase
LSTLRYHTNENFSIFYGYDACVVESLAMVADGWVAGTGNLIPSEASKIYQLTKDGRLDEARALWFKIKPFIDLCTTPTEEGNPAPWLAILKEGLNMRGQHGGIPRKPTKGLPNSVRKKLTEVLQALGHLPVNV